MTPQPLTPEVQQLLRRTIAGNDDSELVQRLAASRQLAASLQQQIDALLRTPYEIEVLSRPAIISREPDFCSEAEYVVRKVEPDVVYQAVDWLIDKYGHELENKVTELLGARA